MHVLQWALTADRVALGEAASAREAASIMAAAPVGDGGRRVGVGFRDGLWPDEPTLELLDAATGEVPTYLVNADVHSVWLNSAAFRREGFEPRHPGSCAKKTPSRSPDGSTRSTPRWGIAPSSGWRVPPPHADSSDSSTST